jgi:peptidyl-tRNA hydrolase, PTH1 family
MPQDIRLIAGLGNPGDPYAETRHNAGFWFLDALARHFGASFSHEKKFNADLARARIGGQEVFLLKPRTFMNVSGEAVGPAMRYFRFSNAELLCAYDELDLPPGVARFKFDGGHGGHNGMRDLFKHLGDGKFHRLRIGIGHPGDKTKVTPWVLGRPTAEQEQAIQARIKAAVDLTERYLKGDFEAVMLQLHSASPAGAGK